MAKADPIEQLRTINELLARAADSDPEQAEHARRAIDFFQGSQGQSMKDFSLAECTDRLALLHFGTELENALAFTHWHVPSVEDFSPLWIRQAIVGQMKKLAGRRSALLLVTGLREAVCPEGRYWTKARQTEYERVRGQINDLVCFWASRGSQLQVVML